MKIKYRLMLAVIPLVLIIFSAASLVTSTLSNNILKEQKRENSQLLTANMASRLDGKIDQYLNIAQDLGSSMITSINIETTLRLFLRRYPQFSQVFYTHPDGKVSHMVPYSEELIGFDFSQFEGWKNAEESGQPVISQASIFFEQASVMLHAPCLLSYNNNREAHIEGHIIIQLRLEKLFEELAGLNLGEKETLYIFDSQQQFLHHPDSTAVLKSGINILSPENPWNDVQDAMKNGFSGFAVYSDMGRQNYLSFAPINQKNWVLAVGGNYLNIQQEVNKISFISFLVIICGLFLEGLFLFIIINKTIQPVEVLTEAARSISRGKKHEIPVIDSSSEIGTLSRWMNSMVLELRNHQMNLERIIDDRTLELKQTNEELEETVEELNQSNYALQQARDNLETRVRERTEDLHEAHRYIKKIIDSIPSALLALDEKGLLVQMNLAARNRLKIQDEQAINTPFWELVSSLDQYKEIILQKINTAENWHNRRLEHEENQEIKIDDASLFPIIMSHQKGSILLLRDISKEVFLEETLRQSQRMESVGQLAGGVAHDFNNMLSGIMGGAELLQKRMGDDKKSARYINLILDTAEHASILTRKLLSFSHKKIRNPQPIDVNTSLIDVITLLKRSLNKNVTIKTSFQQKEAFIISDLTEFHNLFINLGINSGHAMPVGGTLSFETEEIDLDENYCRQSPFDIKPGCFIEIKVADTGTGIKKELQKKVFEPFFTTKSQGEGTGLGLSSVLSIVKQNDGEILLESEENLGTVFSLHFPCSTPAILKQSEEQDQDAKGEGCILVIDDEEVIRKNYKELLEYRGYSVLTAENGLRGFEIFRKNQKRIDAIILDMIMPVMNGRECFYSIREHAPEIPIIISSGFAREEEFDDLKKQGFSALLVKPVRSNVLISALKKALEKL